MRDELLPLEQVRDQRLKELVILLDQKHGEAGLDGEELEELSGFLAVAASVLLEEQDDEQLELIYQRHSDGDEMEEDAIFQTEFKHLLNEVLDAGLDEDLDLNSPEGKRAVAYLLEEEEEAERMREHRARAAAEQAEAALARHAAQLDEAIDGLFRELADTPDANRVMDEDARQARLDLVRRAEAAVGARDLHALLSLGFECEQRGLIGHLSEKQIAECNKLLKEELRLLELENAWNLDRTAEDLLDIPVEHIRPEVLLREMKIHAGELRAEVTRLEHDLVELQDLRKLPAWLRKLDERDEFDW